MACRAAVHCRLVLSLTIATRPLLATPTRAAAHDPSLACVRRCIEWTGREAGQRERLQLEQVAAPQRSQLAGGTTRPSRQNECS